MTLPDWLARTRRGPHRAAQVQPCPHCHAPTLVGLDADNLALPATIDPTPIDPPTELLALLTGRATYNLHRLPGRLEIERRNQWRIAGPRRTTVHPEHRCGKPLPPDEIVPTRRTKKGKEHDAPPY